VDTAGNVYVADGGNAGCSNLLRRTRSGNSYGLIALTTTADVKIGRERPPRSPLAARSHVVVLWTFT